MSQKEKVRVLFICLGNICRSPTAQAIFENLVAREGLADRIQVDSAGTGDWHVGRPPDGRALAAALEREYAMDHLRARVVVPGDFGKFDYILAMDGDNLANLEVMKPDDYRGHLGLLLDFGNHPKHREVPDPYFGGEDGFRLVLDLIEDAAAGLLDHIRRHKLNRDHH